MCRETDRRSSDLEHGDGDPSVSDADDRGHRSIEPLFTDRLCLRTWTEDDRDDFAAMNQDPDVMSDLGGPIDRDASDQKLDRFNHGFATVGHGRWVIERIGDGRFVGYAGIMPRGPDHPLGSHVDIGWRLIRDAWGDGFATEAATAALTDGFERVGLAEVLAWTSPDNGRSQAVMHRLGLTRDPDRDFTIADDVMGSWHGLVWSARIPAGRVTSY